MWFDTQATAQPAYGDWERYYDLDYSTNLAAPWMVVPGYVDIHGDGSTIVHTNLTGSNLSYRVRARLR